MAKIVLGLGPLDEVLGVPVYGNTLYQYIVFILVFVLSLLIAKLISILTKRYIVNKERITKGNLNFIDRALKTLDAPLAYFIVLIGLFAGVNYLSLESDALSTAGNVLELLAVLGVFWVITRIMTTYIKYGLINKAIIKDDRGFQTYVLPLLNKTVKVGIAIIAAIVILGNLGFDMTALVASFGIMGLAVGLAAKDVLSDIFGGISIFTKKLFFMGDNITIMGYTGIAEEVDLRTTRIRTADGKIVSVPNALVAANPVTLNIKGKPLDESKGTVQITMEVNLAYGTSSSKVAKAIRIIKESISKTKGCKKNPEVAFTDFKSSGIGITAIYEIESTEKIMNARHNVNMSIKKELEDNGIKLTYPTSTVYLERGETFK